MKYQVGFLLLGFVATALAQESCQSGKCVFIHQCPKLYKMVDTFKLDPSGIDYLKSKGCGYEHNYPKVCCTEKDMEEEANSTASRFGSNSNDNNSTYSTTTKTINIHNDEQTKDMIEKAKLLPTDCGQDISRRIFGGNKTEPGEFPWMALLEYKKLFGNITSCGGVLINKRYVLTAAHCLASVPKSWRLVGVILGEYNTVTSKDCEFDPKDKEEVCADESITVGIEETIVHENYTDRWNIPYNDIALIRLSRDVAFSTYIKPICLPCTSNIDSNLIVAGWGKTQFKSESEVLLKAQLPFVDQNKCKEKYRKLLSNGQFCAGGEDGIDTCRGDSGGPAMQKSVRPSDGMVLWQSVGIVSFGLSNCGTRGFPGVYTNVHHYLPWIYSKIRE